MPRRIALTCETFDSVGDDLGLLGLRRTQIVTIPAARSAALANFFQFAGEVGGHEQSLTSGFAAAAPCSAATPTNSITLSRLRLERRSHSDGVGVNSPFTVHQRADREILFLLSKRIAFPTPLNPTLAASLTLWLQS